MKVNYKIVVIDDEPMVTRGLSEIVPWNEIGCEVVGQAEDGREGLALVRQTQPDIVITDIQMPLLSGLEMIKELIKEKKDIKFIIMTGYRQFEYAKEAIDLGVNKFLLKPTNLEQLKKAVVELTVELDEQLEHDEGVMELKKKLAVYEAINDTESPDDQDEDTHKVKYLAKQAITYMKSNYSEKIDLQNVADQLFISTWYLCKLFKQEIGSSFVEILNEIRIQEAKRLLIESNLKIYEICERVGYMDNPYFTKTFKRYVGMTPNKYRNEHY
jgi:YesN/AraC family two-component response regulator